jgi:hypothetical protein
MAKGRPLSAAHKAAISAGMKRYWATKSAGGGSARHATSQHLETGKQISRADAARIMFGSAGAAKKIAHSKKKRR